MPSLLSLMQKVPSFLSLMQKVPNLSFLRQKVPSPLSLKKKVPSLLTFRQKVPSFLSLSLTSIEVLKLKGHKPDGWGSVDNRLSIDYLNHFVKNICIILKDLTVSGFQKKIFVRSCIFQIINCLWKRVHPFQAKSRQKLSFFYFINLLFNMEVIYT